MILLLMFTTFTALVAVNLQFYYQYPTIVDVTVDYAEKLPFPGVTICNQNMYR